MDLEERAREILPQGVYDYVAGGAGDELTLQENVAAWQRIRLLPRVLRDVSAVDLGTTALGTDLGSPIGVAPTAFHRMLHPDGEVASAAGVAAAGALHVVSTRSTTPVEQVAEALGDNPWWYQVYVLRDRGLTEELVRRAVTAGAKALVLTADTPRLGLRLRDVRNDFTLPPNLGSPESLDRPGNLADQDPAVTFDDIGWLASTFGLPVVVKGVLRGDDAKSSIAAGAAAIWVSNHGGRQLDGAVATADALPAVVDSVGDSAEVYVDGGVRRGIDVLRGIALGAGLVFVGRPVSWALAVGGSELVATTLQTLRDELELALALAGCPKVGDVTSDLVAR
jgi:4-hydroxymandelate oxidase